MSAAFARRERIAQARRAQHQVVLDAANADAAGNQDARIWFERHARTRSRTADLRTARGVAMLVAHREV